MIVARGLGFGGGAISAHGFGFGLLVAKRGAIVATIEILSTITALVEKMETVEGGIEFDQISSAIEKIGGEVTTEVENAGGTVTMTIESGSVTASIEE